MTPRATALRYVTRLPPSPSGVAAYAQVFLDVLRRLGDVEVEPLPADPRRSQSLVLAVRLARRLDRAARRRPGTVTFVELAGRGVAEFWAAWYLARRGRRVWVMVHDVPELSGGAFFTTLLDRRGGRRLAAALSATLGRAAERSLLTRAERVLCLSASGARALVAAHRLDREVEAVPHVALLSDTTVEGRTEILVPGYIGSAEDFLPLVPAMAALPAGWTLALGACAPEAEQAALTAATAAGVLDRVRLLGFGTEDELQAAFDRAAVVVRWRRHGWGGGEGPTARHAVSGPLVAAWAHGCAVVTNDSRGTAELFGPAQVVVVGDGGPGEREVVAAVAGLVADEAARTARGEAGRRLARRAHSPAAVAEVLRRQDDRPARTEGEAVDRQESSRGSTR